MTRRFRQRPGFRPFLGRDLPAVVFALNIGTLLAMVLFCSQGESMIPCASLHLLMTLTLSGEQTLTAVNWVLSSRLEQDDDLQLVRSTIFDWEYRGPSIRAPFRPSLHILPPKEVAQPSRRRHDVALLPPANSQELIAQSLSPSSSREPIFAEPEIRQKYLPLVRHRKPATTFLLPVASVAGKR